VTPPWLSFQIVALVVRRQLIDIFRFRQRATGDLLLPGGAARIAISEPRVSPV